MEQTITIVPAWWNNKSQRRQGVKNVSFCTTAVQVKKMQRPFDLRLNKSDKKYGHYQHEQSCSEQKQEQHQHPGYCTFIGSFRTHKNSPT